MDPIGETNPPEDQLPLEPSEVAPSGPDARPASTPTPPPVEAVAPIAPGPPVASVAPGAPEPPLPHSSQLPDTSPVQEDPEPPVPKLHLPTGPRALPSAALTHMRIRAFIRVLITTAIATAAGLGLAMGFPESGTPIGLRFALPFALPLLLFVQALIMPKQRWKRARWSVDATTIVWRHGVIFQAENTVPRSRVQHIEVTQGPLQRKLGLAALVIYTAGERLNAVTIAGMAAEEARALRNTLLDRVGGHVV